MPHHTIEESLYFYTRYHLFSMVNFPKSQYFLSPDTNNDPRVNLKFVFRVNLMILFFTYTAQKMMLIEDFFSKCENIQFPWKLLTVTKEMLGLRLHFPCSKSFNTLYHVLYKQGKKKQN